MYFVVVEAWSLPLRCSCAELGDMRDAQSLCRLEPSRRTNNGSKYTKKYLTRPNEPYVGGTFNKIVAAREGSGVLALQLLISEIHVSGLFDLEGSL